jgi:carboxyl-terminal processing protease
MSKFRTFVSVALLVALAFSFGFVFGNSNRAATAQQDNPEEAFGPLFETYNLIKGNFVDPTEDEDLVIGAINGMLESLGDDNTNYLTTEELEAWNESLSGEFEGIGATVRQDEETGGLEIVSPLPDSPAERAGLQAGDIIITVGGDDVTEFSQTEIINMVRGPAGTPVRLGILRDGETELLEITIIRDRIQMPTVEFEVLEGNVGYVRLYQFSQNASQDLADVLIDIDANNLNGLVLDLRGNPGGFLQTSLDVLRMFVNDGVILIEQLPGDEERVFEATGNAIAPDVPLVLIVDEGSASASELVAGSLRDLERAVIVGTSTFGKNTVQTINPLSNGGAVRLSIARWVTPDGNSVEGDGLLPDVVIEFDPEAEEDNQLQAAIRALKGINREQLEAPFYMRF